MEYPTLPLLSEIHFGEVEIETRGENYEFRVPLCLGEIDPKAVSAQLYADHVERESAFCSDLTRLHALAGATNGYLYCGEVPARRPAEHYTPRVVAFHPAASVPLEAGHILWRS